MMPGGKPFGLETLFGNLGTSWKCRKKLIRWHCKVGKGAQANTDVQAEVFLGGAQKLLGGLGGIKDLLPFVNAFSQETI